jgi:adenosylmethionine-8-amino-7-oxononanoate aminotransferase
MNNADWQRRDLQVLWHPCSQMKDHEDVFPMIPIRRGEGVWLEDFDGNRYIDAISSWWVNLFGHAHPHINRRLREQAETLEHVILAGLTHPAATQLAEQLVALTPPGLDRVFYADSGSAAVEIALKMSFHHWKNLGRTRTRFACLSGSYHGETLGALAVSDVGLYRDTYAPLLLEPIVVPSPDAFERAPGASWREHAEARFADMERMLAEHHEDLCAVIVEPLVQCAGGMRMYDPVYLKKLREACDRYEVHLIADEIAVGFGRTGTLFACEQAGITPDLMCLSKGLTGGYLPLSAVLTRETIYQSFYDDYATFRAFLHSHSYTGNALCCAAALAVLELFAGHDVLGENRRKAARMREAVEPLNDHPNVAEIRQTGMILAMEMVDDHGRAYPLEERRGIRVYRHALEHQALLRPLGNVVYFMPPYVISDEEIDHLGRVAIAGIEHATGRTL